MNRDLIASMTSLVMSFQEDLLQMNHLNLFHFLINETFNENF